MTISTVVSNFEVLVKRLIPPSVDIVGAGRTIIQGYFLTISNLNLSSPVTLRINFRAQTPNIANQPILAFFDINGTNVLLSPTATSSITQTYTVTIPAGDTGLFILQADVRNPILINNPNTELRGYVTIALDEPVGNKSFDLLMTPEHRGTFLPKGYVVSSSSQVMNLDFDQLAYALPTATPGNKFNLTQMNH